MSSEQAILNELILLNRTMGKIGKFVDNSDSDTMGDIIYDDFDKIKKKLQNHQNEFVRDYSKNIKSMADIHKLGGKNAQGMIDEFKKQQTRFKLLGEDAAPLAEDMKILGISTKNLSRKTSDVTDDIVSLNRIIDSTKIIMKDQIEETEKLGKSDRKANKERRAATGKWLTQLSALATFIGKDVLDGYKASARAGMQLTAQHVLQSKLMGMSTGELYDTQRTYKQSMHAAGINSVEFAKKMTKASHEMFRFTGSLKDGAIFAAEANKLNRLTGGNDTLEDATIKYKTAFTSLQNITGITTEKFHALNNDLLNNSDINSSMAKMDSQRRGAHLQYMMAERRRLTVMGLFDDQAQNVVKTLEEMRGGKAVNRLEKAAKTESFFGAMGMASEGRELAAIIRKGARATKEDKERQAVLLAAGVKESNRRKSGTFNEEVAQQTLESATGMYELMTGDLLRLESQSGNKVDKVDTADTAPDPNNIFNKILEAMLKFSEMVATAFPSGWMGTLAGLILGKSAIDAATNLISGVDEDGNPKKRGDKTRKGRGRGVGKVFGKLGTLGKQLGGVMLGFGTTLVKSAPAVMGGVAKAGGHALSGTLGTVTKGFSKMLLPLGRLAMGISGFGLQLAAMAGWFTGTKINEWINENAPEVGDAIGGTIAGTIDSFKDGSLIGDTTGFWKELMAGPIPKKINPGDDPNYVSVVDQLKSIEEPSAAADLIKQQEEIKTLEADSSKAMQELMEKNTAAAEAQAKSLKKMEMLQEELNRLTSESAIDGDATSFAPYRTGGAKPIY